MQPDDNNDLDFDEATNDTQTTTETTETPPETTPSETPAPVTPPEAPEDPNKTPEDDKGAGEGTPPAEPGTPPSETGQPPAEEDKETTQELPKPLTADEARQLFQDIRDQERNSTKALDEAEQQVLNAYHPNGLPEVVTTEDGKELRTPQDVVDASGGQMSMEEAASWLLNEQAKLDRQIGEIKKSARELAEVNYNFRQGAVKVIEKYQAIFNRWPGLQNKVYKNYMKTVKMDNEKDLLLSAPDIEDYYNDYMEPYVMAYSHQSQTPPPAPATPPEAAPPTPTIPESRQTVADRMDVSGDGGGGSDDSTADPNDPEASLNKLFGE